jgi:hypothetical protein
MSRSTRSRALSAAACVGVALAMLAISPAIAAAAEEGVIVDPESPTGKEYAIPLDKARSDTGGPSKPSRQTSDGVSQHAQPFGEGITPATTTNASPAPKRTRPAKRPVRTRRSRVPPVQSPAPPAAAENSSLASASAGSGTGWSLGIVFGVLVLGAGLGIGLRRLSRRRAP